MKRSNGAVQRQRPDAAAYLRSFADEGERRRNSTSIFLRHPLRAARLFHSLRAIPVLKPDLDAGRAGEALRASLTIGSRLRRFLLREVTYVLPLGDSYEEYSKGSSKKLMRNSASNAARRGVNWSVVHDEDERRSLLAVADDYERNHPRARYRGDAPDNSELLDVPLWMVVRDAAGEPLVLAMVVADGEWALLRYSRAMQDSETASFSRYYMMSVLARLLIERGVRYLVADGSPLRVGPGLYYFMERVGFAAFRVRVHPGRIRVRAGRASSSTRVL